MENIGRRGILRGLATLPLIGGSVKLIGRPTASAAPVTDDLLHNYKAWLRNEHCMLTYELSGYDADRAKHLQRDFYWGNPGSDWHYQWPMSADRLSGWPEAPQPSTRAAIVLSAVGCPLT